MVSLYLVGSHCGGLASCRLGFVQDRRLGRPVQGYRLCYHVVGDFRLVRGRRLHLTPQCRFPMCRDLCLSLMSLPEYWGFQRLLPGHSVEDFLFHAAFHRLDHMW